VHIDAVVCVNATAAVKVQVQKEVDHILQASRMQRLEGHASAHDAGN
jgi:hypothetical protein